MATSEEIFRDAVALLLDVRAELTERLIATLAEDISPEITSAQLGEFRGIRIEMGYHPPDGQSHYLRRDECNQLSRGTSGP